MTQYERPSVGHVTPRVRADDDMEQPVDALDEYKPAVAQSLPADLRASDGLPRPIADAAAPTNALTRHLGLRGPGQGRADRQRGDAQGCNGGEGCRAKGHGLISCCSDYDGDAQTVSPTMT